MLFCTRDLDLDLITLMYESYLNIRNMCPYSKNEVSGSRLSEVTEQTTQTDRDTQTDVRCEMG